eukprot:jgi/Mesvir1/11943/Mv00274-RA.1
MGIDLDRLVTQPVNPEYVCILCKGLMWDPVEGPCEHSMCRACIEPWLATEETCPHCHEPLALNALRQAHRFFRMTLESLVITCENRLHGCEATPRLGDLRQHLGNDCGAVIVECSHEGCNEKGIRRRDLAGHEGRCPHGRVACPQCHELVRPGERQAHIDNDCGKTIIPCPLNGCNIWMAREEMDDHLQSLPEEHLGILSESLTRLREMLATCQQECEAMATAEAGSVLRAQVDIGKLEGRVDSLDAKTSRLAEAKRARAGTPPRSSDKKTRMSLPTSRVGSASLTGGRLAREMNINLGISIS